MASSLCSRTQARERGAPAPSPTQTTFKLPTFKLSTATQWLALPGPPSSSQSHRLRISTPKHLLLATCKLSTATQRPRLRACSESQTKRKALSSVCACPYSPAPVQLLSTLSTFAFKQIRTQATGLAVKQLSNLQLSNFSTLVNFQTCTFQIFQLPRSGPTKLTSIPSTPSDQSILSTSHLKGKALGS